VPGSGRGRQTVDACLAAVAVFNRNAVENVADADHADHAVRDHRAEGGCEFLSSGDAHAQRVGERHGPVSGNRDQLRHFHMHAGRAMSAMARSHVAVGTCRPRCCPSVRTTSLPERADYC